MSIFKKYIKERKEGKPHAKPSQLLWLLIAGGSDDCARGIRKLSSADSKEEK